MLGKLYSGINPPLEEEANRILAESRKGITNHSEKNDYLSDEQLLMRYTREVYNQNGFPDKSIVAGYYRRSYNPNMGKRPTRTTIFPEENTQVLYEW